jgi:hypothetical protein
VVVSVRFVSGVDLAAFDSAELEVYDPTPEVSPAAALARATPRPLGSIQGQVTQGGLAQPNLTVILYDPMTMKEITRTRTTPAGTFVFKDLNPGAYKVYAFNEASLTRDTKDVVVEPGKTARANPDLFR